MTQAGDLAIFIDFVEFEYRKFDLLLGSGVIRLLPFLGTTPQAEHQVKGGFFLDVVIGQGVAILQLLASEDQTLLIKRDSLLVLNFLFHIYDGVAWFDHDHQGISFTCERFFKDLHGCNLSLSRSA